MANHRLSAGFLTRPRLGRLLAVVDSDDVDFGLGLGLDLDLGLVSGCNGSSIVIVVMMVMVWLLRLPLPFFLLIFLLSSLVRLVEECEEGLRWSRSLEALDVDVDRLRPFRCCRCCRCTSRGTSNFLLLDR